MSRPFISYNTWVSYTSTYVWYDVRGVVTRTGTYTSYAANRFAIKQASSSTPSKYRGKFVTPTAYLSRWYSVTCPTPGPTTVRRVSLGAGFDHRCETSGTGVDSGSTRDPAAMYSLPSSAKSMLEIKALNKLRNQQFNAGVAIAEAGETAKLFTTSVRRIASAVQSFRTSRPRDFSQAVANEGKRNRDGSWKRVPDSWLELQYGWNPLMADINGAVNELSQTVRRNDPVIVVKSKKSFSTTLPFGFTALNCTVYQDIATSVDAKVKLVYKLNNWILAEISRLGLSNPLEIVWERVPYSFVIDWFLPVGNWLSALGGDFGYSFQNGHLSVFVRMTESHNRTVASSPGFDSFTLPVQGHGGYFQRTLYGTSPVPGLYFKSPVSSGHIANALSLLATALARRR
jgi:hypothetical protein